MVQATVRFLFYTGVILLVVLAAASFGGGSY